MPISSEGCCGTSGASDNKVTCPCKYIGERLSYSTNTGRCTEINKFECDWVDYKRQHGPANTCEYERSSSDSSVDKNVWTWTVRNLISIKIAMCTHNILMSSHITISFKYK